MTTMTSITLGKPVPDFSFAGTKPNLQSISEFRGKNVILFFYPKDNTPGCTLEAQAFRDYYQPFQQLNTEIIGISRDSLKSHEGFICKHDLPFLLISDTDQKICNLFDVIKTKNRYGKMVTGIERSTFLIDQNGILQKEWRNVKVDNHVTEVLAAVQQQSK